MADFSTVCRVADIANGAAKMFVVNGKEIAVYNLAGTFYATQQACLHRNGPLSEGDIDGCVVTCPWHGWEYDIPTGEHLVDRKSKLATYPVKVENGEVKVAA
ncbi:Rieske 2Fe-2S domain-containing protein [candidate division KSB1 bacterium]|nr:Rieske 2Fe-2S domain-containing protein [candidate division KSB1 bacterium]